MIEDSFAASIRTRVGQIKKANSSPSADSWGQIELACDKLLDAAADFERRTPSPLPHDEGAHD